MTEQSCSICDTSITLWRQKDGYSIYRCRHCGHGQVLPVLSLDKVREIYSISGHDSEDVKRSQVTLHVVLQQEKTYPNSTLDAARIAQNAVRLSNFSHRRLLDVGAGYGLFSKAFLDAGFDVEAIENATNERAVFQELNGFQPFSGLFEDFSVKKRYSHLLMSQVLEHVTDPGAWAAKAGELLEPGGLLLIALPNFGSLFRQVMQEREPYIIPPYHLNYFTSRSMRALLHRHGFEVLRLHTVSRLPFPKILGKMRIPPLLSPLLGGLGNLTLSVIDLAQAGSVLNVYARKLA